MDVDFIRAVLDDFFRRSEAIQAAGGISYKDYVDGREVPDGWVLDTQLEFFVPPDWEATLSPL